MAKRHAAGGKKPGRLWSRLRLVRLEDRTVPASWATMTAVNNQLPDSVQGAMVLSDGSILLEGDGQSSSWYKLTPNSSGSYANGTVTTLASMHVQRLAFAQNMLPSGKVLVLGGEYSSSGSDTNTGEIYDPVANTWTNITPFPQSNFGDDPTEVLPDGRVLAGYLGGTPTYLYTSDPNGGPGSWAATGSKIHGDASDEETWVKLPDNSILSYDVNGTSNGHNSAQRYVLSTGQWVDASGTNGVPVPLSSSAVGSELGPGFLLSDGRVLFIGATNNTAIYTPSTNTWVAGPSMPTNVGADDAPGAELPNGHVLFAADTNSPDFTKPTRLFDFDPSANTITDVTPTTPSSLASALANNPAFIDRMLVLPNGHVLLMVSNSTMYEYTPDGSPSAAWQPTISSIVYNGSQVYTLTGTQLNGISEGASYGDDAEMSSNYPIVRLTSSSGTVYFARTFNWSSTGVQTGTTPVTTQFTPPANLPGGAYSLVVVANGIASAPVTFEAPVDTIPPGFTSPLLDGFNPPGNFQVIQGQALGFGGTATDNVGLAVITVSISNSRVTNYAVVVGLVSGTSVPLSPYSIDTGNTFYAGVTGAYTATISATDAVGNTSSQTWYFTVYPSTGGRSASFQGLGDLAGGSFYSQAYGVSADGSTVVGMSDSATGNQAFRWTANGGMVGLGALTGGSFLFSQANGVSSDGSVIIGYSNSAPGYQAFRWTASTGMVGLGAFSPGSNLYDSRAFGVSADGSVVVGKSNSSAGGEAFRWTTAGMVGLGDLTGGSYFSEADAVSADGSVAVGDSSSTSGTQAFRWTSAGGIIGIGYPPGGFGSSAFGVSSDGSVVVGQSSTTPGPQAFRWTATGGMAGLGDLPGGSFASYGRAVSADGSVVVGDSYSASGDEAFRWTAADGMRSLRDILVTDYGLTNQLAGWTLTNAYSCSADGRVIVGIGTDPAGKTEGWIARLDQPPNATPPTTVAAVQVNDGSAQRSEVRSIKVTFSSPVTFPGGNANAAAAFQLNHVQTGNNVVLSAAVSADSQGRTVVTLVFSGNETDAVSAEDGGVPSLADGRYSLTIVSGAVTGANGYDIDGDYSGTPGGNYVSPTDTQGGGPGELGLYRLFGDALGSGIDDQLALGAFRSAFNSSIGNPAYVAYLDADNSGIVDQLDLAQFRGRFNSSVFPTTPQRTPAAAPSTGGPPGAAPAPFVVPATVPPPIAAPIAVSSIVVNDGSVQRSKVRTITVAFPSPVTFPSGDANAATLQLPHLINDVSLAAAVSADNHGRTVATLTFSDSETGGISAQYGGIPSLADGRYQLTIFGNAVIGQDGIALDGDGTAGSSYVSPTNTLEDGPSQLQLVRLLGDTDDDGIVDQVALGDFRLRNGIDVL